MTGGNAQSECALLRCGAGSGIIKAATRRGRGPEYVSEGEAAVAAGPVRSSRGERDRLQH